MAAGAPGMMADTPVRLERDGTRLRSAEVRDDEEEFIGRRDRRHDDLEAPDRPTGLHPFAPLARRKPYPPVRLALPPPFRVVGPPGHRQPSVPVRSPGLD